MKSPDWRSTPLPIAVRLAPQQRVNFGRDILPILSEHCYACHGPDSANRQADLRLDIPDLASAALPSGKKAIVPRHPEDSALIDRIFSEEPSERMPPPESRGSLTNAQKALLRQWIESGAEYQEHWSFITPIRPEVPAVSGVAECDTWARNPIDHFVLAKLSQEGLQPSAEADRATLLRRIYMDLTGLPPTPEEVDAYLADTRPDAYELLVDRLLASPHYGEMRAQHWLDVSRFGDTNGYQDDNYRSIWPYRDYVVEAFNQNMPFDRFTIENLAGDLLPHSSRSQKVATGFLRNHCFNEENGADPDEYLVVYAVDRVNTFGTVWLGLTLGCAQCHDHKYDPISQREYYQLYAFFNSVRGERGAEKGLLPPILRLPNDEQQRRLTELQKRKEVIATEAASRNDTQRESFSKRIEDDERALLAAIPTTLVMEEMDERRPAYILKRGDFQQPGAQVQPKVPAVLPQIPADTPATRLQLAQWLTDPSHPLTARVVVNRFWQECFGEGLVRTPENFGTRGEAPTHPELLDWLAVEFIENGWNVKALLRQIVTSATYRQSSRLTTEMVDSDPDNRLLARGPSFRLSAEQIRDQALAAAGILCRKIGGPSVAPPQPAEYFAGKGKDLIWNESSGEDRYRRGIYTYWRRANLYPSLSLFDAPSRETCVPRRTRTNTPLQALVCLNDPVFVEAARGLAGVVLTKNTGETDAKRIIQLFRRVMIRNPTSQELEDLRSVLDWQIQHYRSQPEAAHELCSVGSLPYPEAIDISTLAAWTCVANVILNTHEALCRE